MINVTERAANELQRAIEEHKKEDANVGDIFVRIGVKGGGCSGFQNILALEEGKNERDTVYRIGELDFVIDNLSAMYLEGVSLDFVDEGLVRRGFKFNNPNATGTCGCGSSFSM